MHAQDMLRAADPIKRGLRVPQMVLAEDLQAWFGYVSSLQAGNGLL